ncbi:hypothetical protein H0H87_008958 [Tephrocybe sp. NHM501043]|nr:hypothetical protein H0H87_008958 [Tephrocybe sp. NHM501043]
MEEEEIHFNNVITTFRNYAQYSLAANNRRRKDIYRLPTADQQVLEVLGYKEKLDQVDDAIRKNAEFLSLIVASPEIFGRGLEAEEDGAPNGNGEDAIVVQSGNEEAETEPGRSHNTYDHFVCSSSISAAHAGLSPSYSHSHSHSHETGHSGHGHSHGSHGDTHHRYRPTDFDMDKLRSTLKQFVRDWSEQGQEEREACYEPMKDALVKHFAHVPVEERFRMPGKRVLALHALPVLPHSKQAMLQPISIPDVLPSALPPGSNFSLVAGDFEEIYGVDADPEEPHAGEWDAILTCFFIDTAKNIVNYLRIIHRILAPGGVWVNLGPLLWHFENNNTNDPSVELDLEEVKALARNIGFEISNERTIDTTYTANSEGMLGYIYHAGFWTATKI